MKKFVMYPIDNISNNVCIDGIARVIFIPIMFTRVLFEVLYEINIFFSLSLEKQSMAYGLFF